MLLYFIVVLVSVCQISTNAVRGLVSISAPVPTTSTTTRATVHRRTAARTATRVGLLLVAVTLLHCAIQLLDILSGYRAYVYPYNERKHWGGQYLHSHMGVSTRTILYIDLPTLYTATKL